MTMASLSDLARKLYDILVIENQALRDVDFRTAGQILPHKQACIDALVAARQQTSEAHGLLADGVVRLERALEENRLLLQRAMQVQSRIMSLLAQAARSDAPMGTGYGARGGYSQGDGASRAMAIHKRI